MVLKIKFPYIFLTLPKVFQASLGKNINFVNERAGSDGKILFLSSRLPTRARTQQPRRFPFILFLLLFISKLTQACLKNFSLRGGECFLDTQSNFLSISRQNVSPGKRIKLFCQEISWKLWWIAQHCSILCLATLQQLDDFLPCTYKLPSVPINYPVHQ